MTIFMSFLSFVCQPVALSFSCISILAHSGLDLLLLKPFEVIDSLFSQFSCFPTPLHHPSSSLFIPFSFPRPPPAPSPPPPPFYFISPSSRFIPFSLFLIPIHFISSSPHPSSFHCLSSSSLFIPLPLLLISLYSTSSPPHPASFHFLSFLCLFFPLPLLLIRLYSTSSTPHPSLFLFLTCSSFFISFPLLLIPLPSPSSQPLFLVLFIPLLLIPLHSLTSPSLPPYSSSFHFLSSFPLPLSLFPMHRSFIIYSINYYINQLIFLYRTSTPL